MKNRMNRGAVMGVLIFCGTMGMHAQSLADFANAGDQFLADGEFAKAVESYQKAIELDKDSTDFTTTYNLGLAYEQMSNMKEAMESYKLSIIKGKDDNEVFNKMKAAADAMKCPDCLEHNYREIMQIRPYLTTFVSEKLFYVYAGQGKMKEAIDAAGIVLAENPINFAVLKNTGFIYNGMNKVDSALVYMDRAYEVRQDDAPLNKSIGLIYYNTCENKLAAENRQYEKGTQNNSTYNTMMYNRQNHVRNYYPRAVKLLKEANLKLNDPEITKLVDRMTQALAAYQK